MQLAQVQFSSNTSCGSRAHFSLPVSKEVKQKKNHIHMDQQTGEWETGHKTERDPSFFFFVITLNFLASGKKNRDNKSRHWSHIKQIHVPGAVGLADAHPHKLVVFRVQQHVLDGINLSFPPRQNERTDRARRSRTSGSRSRFISPPP